MFGCNYGTTIVNTAGDKRLAPCTFHLNIEKTDSIYNVFGCYSHFGHQVDGQPSVEELDNLFEQTNRDEEFESDTEFKLLDSIANDYLEQADSPLADEFINSIQSDNKNDLLLDCVETLIKEHENSEQSTFDQYANIETMDVDRNPIKCNGKLFCSEKVSLIVISL
jgi:type I restriction-modification system DNA methylase subunit